MVLLIKARIIADVKICNDPSDPCTTERIKGVISETPTIAETPSNPELPTVDFTNPVTIESITNIIAKPMAGRISNGFCNSGISDSDAGCSLRNIRNDNTIPAIERKTRRSQRFGRNEALINQISASVRRYVTLLASNVACSALLLRDGFFFAICPIESVTAVLETMPPNIPDIHKPNLDPNFFSNKYPTNPKVETMITICQILNGLIWNCVNSWFGKTGKIITVTKINLIAAKNSTLLSHST